MVQRMAMCIKYIQYPGLCYKLIDNVDYGDDRQEHEVLHRTVTSGQRYKNYSHRGRILYPNL